MCCILETRSLKSVTSYRGLFSGCCLGSTYFGTYDFGFGVFTAFNPKSLVSWSLININTWIRVAVVLLVQEMHLFKKYMLISCKRYELRV